MQPSSIVILPVEDGLAAPGIQVLIKSGARRALPLRFGGKPARKVEYACQPLAVSYGIEPAYADHRLRGTGKQRVAAKEWLLPASRAQKRIVLRVRHLI